MTAYPSESERFWSKVDKTGVCWLWTAAINQGYGYFGVPHGVPGNRQWHMVLAHRWAYQHLVGPIPDGLTLDHLCRTRHCVRPDHLEPVTNRVNVLRGEAPAAIAWRTNQCQHGHSLTGAYIRPDTGTRQCRTCKREAYRRYRSRRAA